MLLSPVDVYLSNLRNIQGGSTILHKYNDSVLKCLQDLYPEVEFDKDNFKYPSMNHFPLPGVLNITLFCLFRFIANSFASSTILGG